MTPAELPPPLNCPYEAHRPSDWRRRDVDEKGTPGPSTCGECHPPPFPEEMIERREPRVTESVTPESE